MTRLPLVIVAAIADNGVLGKNNKLLWRLKTDLKRYRAITWGKPMIMGRKTFQSIGKPLPGRETIVLTKDAAFRPEGVHLACNWPEAVRLANEIARRMSAPEIIVAGGREIYDLSLPETDRLRLTFVHTVPEGDVRFPDYDRSLFVETSREDHPAGPDDEHPFTFVDFDHRSR